MFKGNFNATNIAPQQMGDKHPVGDFPFTIANTYGKSVVREDQVTGGMFCVDLQSPAGMITKRYNLWNNSAAAVEIATKELSALCHAVGIFQLTFEVNGQAVPEAEYGRELRGGIGVMKVGLQDPNKPDGWTEVKRIFDKNGNEPGKANNAAPQTQNAFAQPQQQNNNPAPPNNAQNNNGGGWSPPAQQGQPTQWGGGQQAQPQQQQPPQQQNNNAGGTTPPWNRS